MQLPAALMAQGLHLVSVETSTDTTRNTAYGADGRANFHGLME